MKKTHYYIFVTAFFFLFMVFVSEKMYAQGETLESINQEIEDIQKEKLRVQKEIRDAERKELDRLKAKRNSLSDSTDEVLTSDSSSIPQASKETNQADKKTVTPDVNIPQTIVDALPAVQPVKKAEEDVFEAGTTEDKKCSQITSVERPKYSIYRRALCSVIDKILMMPDRTRKVVPKLELSDAEDPLIRLIVATLVKEDDDQARAQVKDFLLKSEKFRTDKQIGSDAKNKGTTSIVSKGGIPLFFALATEYGAATSSTDGTTMTFRVNPAGLFQTIGGASFVELLRERRRSSFLDTLGKISLGFSFDTTRGVPTPTFTGTENQLSAFSFRYEFINERSPLSKKYQSRWKEFVRGDAEEIFQAKNILFKSIFIKPVGGRRQFFIPELLNWHSGFNAKLANEAAEIATLSETEATDKIETMLTTELGDLPVGSIKANASIGDLFTSVELDRKYADARQAAIDDIQKGQVATFEYINFREPIKPDTHSLRFIWERGIYKNWDFTINASLTFYNRKPTNPDVKRIRDFDFSTQLDIPLSKMDIGFLRASALSFAGKYQRLNTDVVNENGTIAPGTKGDIAVGQFKWTIPIGDTGIKIPISFTFANRTELVKEKEVRGNFGFTLDFDSILARLKTFGDIFTR